MPNTATLDSAASHAMSMLGRVLAWTALLAGMALLAVFAAAATIAAGLLVVGAAIAIRLTPKPARARGSETLNARRTPDGWVVETRLR